MNEVEKQEFQKKKIKINEWKWRERRERELKMKQGIERTKNNQCADSWDFKCVDTVKTERKFIKFRNLENFWGVLVFLFEN
jgi:hypothetical protein